MTHENWVNFEGGKPQIQLEGSDRVNDAPEYNLQTTLSAYDGVSKLEDVIDHVNNAEEHDYIEEYIESLSPEERQQVLREPEEVDTGDCLKEFQGQEYGIKSVDIPQDIMAVENLRSSFENYDGEIVGSLVYGSSANGFSVGENMATQERDAEHSDVDVMVIFDDEFSANNFMTPSYVDDGNEFIKQLAESDIPGLEFEEDIHPIGYTTSQIVEKLNDARNGFVDEEEELITLKGAKGIGPDGARKKDKKYEELMRDFWISGLARYNKEKQEQFAEVVNEFKNGFQMIEAGPGELRTDLEFDDYYVDKYLTDSGAEPSKRELLEENEDLAKRHREIKQMMEEHPEAEYRVETVEGDEESEYAETRTEYHAEEEVIEELGLEEKELEQFGNLETSENSEDVNYSLEDFS
jgi:hypothetical protein